jgi:inward rectifier potassium channel
VNKRLRNRAMQIRRIGIEESLWEDAFHRLLRISWKRFFAITTGFYFLLNLIFAALFALRPGDIANIQAGDFLSYYAFSIQTMATVGYGFFNPQTPYAHVLVTIECIVGMFFTALLTGLLFAKFSRAPARIVFSENVLYTTFNGKPALELRLGNIRANRVFEGRATLTALKDEVSTEGEKLRRLYDLKLMRANTPVFTLSWTLYHVIDEESPVYGISLEEMIKNRWELIASFVGIDQDISQSVVANTIYRADHIVRARKFVDMIQIEDDGRRVIDYSKIHEIDV